MLKDLFRKNDKSLDISAPREYTLHAVKIRKLPVGKYIQVLRTLEELPVLLFGKVFPDQSINEVFTYLKGLSKDDLLVLLGRLLTVVPETTCGIISELLDIPSERMLNPDTEDALSLKELAGILLAFWEINDMTDFFATVRRLAAKQSAQNTGSSAGLQ